MGRGVLAHREVIDYEDQWAGVFAHALTDGAIGVPAGEVGEHPRAFDEADVSAASGHLMSKCLCDMGFPDANSAGDRLQQLRAMLPCDVTVIDEGHPLLRERLRALSFRRRQGVLRLVVVLPDGTPGMVAADATDVFGDAGTNASRLATILSVDGVRRLRSRLARDAEAALPSSVSQ